GRRGRGRAQRRAAPQRGQDIERSVNLSFEQAVRGATLEIDVVQPNGQRQTLEVKIPAGVDNGQRIR
ncbi:MAG: J domain-containing protein, partial [Planctomycetales bacterium]|nr:J domain-containing protein [Planctomycetales bacterium]